MTPGELSRIEDTLRRAYGDVLEAVRRDGSSPELMPGFQPGRLGRGFGRPGRAGSSRRLVPVAAAAAVAVIALVGGLIVPGALRPAAAPAGPAHMGYVVATGAVTPVDLATGVAQPSITFPAHGGTTAAAIAPSGRTIYVATYPHYLTPVSTVTGKDGPTIRLGWNARQIVVSPDASMAYILEPSRGVAVVNLAANTAGGFIKMPSAMSLALTPDGRTLYVLHTAPCCTGSTVTPVETATLKLLPPVHTAADLGSSYIAVAPDGKTAYVVGTEAHGYKVVNSTIQWPKGWFSTGVLTPISTATNTALRPVQLGRGEGLAGPISFSPDGSVAYLGGDPVTAVNLDTGTVSWTARSPASGYAPLVSPGGRTVYAVGDSAFGVRRTSAYRIDAATGTLQGPVVRAVHGSIDSAPWNNGDTTADLSSDGTALYAQIYNNGDGNASQSSRLEAVDTATGRVDWVLHLRDGGDLLIGPS
jgi:hypothetical protein